MLFFDELEQHESVHPIHQDISEDEIHAMSGEEIERFLARLCGKDRISLYQDILEEIEYFSFIVDDKDCSRIPSHIDQKEPKKMVLDQKKTLRCLPPKAVWQAISHFDIYNALEQKKQKPGRMNWLHNSSFEAALREW
jgi:hypothetical protein